MIRTVAGTPYFPIRSVSVPWSPAPVAARNVCALSVPFPTVYTSRVPTTTERDHVNKEVLEEFAKPDPSDIQTRMITAIVLGAKKEGHHLIQTEADSRMWDRLSANIAEIKRKGHVVVYDVDDD